ncbi:regulator of microtubule dynamics protein 2 isoform X1 [Anguilla anguilla]|uniref:regulator of microtubule dynamics protein 2 isoform X1 n=2 Tax=Anguilla anguilla TaxID=7936 RepID=UPI0015A87224|nr:regulator of microtubule dynamics protein 2 isoform X1 [Anguilla anguilla]
MHIFMKQRKSTRPTVRLGIKSHQQETTTTRPGRMAQMDSRVLVLSVLAGAAGVSLVVAWYRSRRGRLWLSSGDEWRDAGGGGAGAALALQARQAEVADRLGALIQCVSELKDEVRALKDALPRLQEQVRTELRGRGAEGAHRTPRRKRAEGTARAEGHSSEEGAESEGGYVTAHTDTEEEEEEQLGEVGGENAARPNSITEEKDDLAVLLERADSLFKGSESEKKEGLVVLLEKKEEFGLKTPFLWRLMRAYVDAHDLATDVGDKKSHAAAGKMVGEEAITLNPMCAESHQWYAILCGLLSEYESVQNKIKNGYLFKDHLDKAIELKPQDPLSYYLLGRWCYAVAQLSWIERKVAATLFGEPPSASVHDALKNFLKVEEIHPKYSKCNYVFLAKCYKDLGQKRQALEMCNAAMSMCTVSKEDEEAQNELSSLLPSLSA